MICPFTGYRQSSTSNLLTTKAPAANFFPSSLYNDYAIFPYFVVCYSSSEVTRFTCKRGFCPDGLRLTRIFTCFSNVDQSFFIS